MKTLRIGSKGPQVQLLQLALQRAGYSPNGTDGIFGVQTSNALRKFQISNGLSPDGIAGPRTHAALYPWYAGYATHTVRQGDTLYNIAQRYGTTVRAIEIAMPGIDPLRLRIGSTLIVPLSFNVVPTTIDYCSSLIDFCCMGLAARYPFIQLGEMGKSEMGKPLYTLTLGSGTSRAFFNAAHHANEWITTPVLLKYCEELAQTYAYGGEIFSRPTQQLLGAVRLSIAPAIDPDGIDLVTGDLISGAYYTRARAIGADYPEIPFPSGWKANILGTDLNLQYPAGWSMAKEIKYAQGFVSPAPRDFVGSAPLSAKESRAVYDYTLQFSPQITLSYHTQGKVIYWKFLDYEPKGSRELALEFGAVSGYAVEETPYSSGFAGYKDWFIQNYQLPGYTIECGLGQSPLPLSQFDEIYRDNLGILTLALEFPAKQHSQ